MNQISRANSSHFPQIINIQDSVKQQDIDKQDFEKNDVTAENISLKDDQTNFEEQEETSSQHERVRRDVFKKIFRNPFRAFEKGADTRKGGTGGGGGRGHGHEGWGSRVGGSGGGITITLGETGKERINRERKEKERKQREERERAERVQREQAEKERRDKTAQRLAQRIEAWTANLKQRHTQQVLEWEQRWAREKGNEQIVDGVRFRETATKMGLTKNPGWVQWEQAWQQEEQAWQTFVKIHWDNLQHQFRFRDWTTLGFSATADQVNAENQWREARKEELKHNLTQIRVQKAQSLQAGLDQLEAAERLRIQKEDGQIGQFFAEAATDGVTDYLETLAKEETKEIARIQAGYEVDQTIHHEWY